MPSRLIHPEEGLHSNSQGISMKMNSTPTRSRMDRGDFFWLAYLVFYFLDPLFRRSLVYWLECLAFAAIFVALYVGLFQLKRFELRVACIVGMYLLGAVTYPVNSGAITFFIYCAALLPFVVQSTRAVLICFVVEALLVVAEGWLLHQGHEHLSLWSLASALFFIAVVGGSNVFFAQKQRADSKLRMAHEEIEALAVVAERERIARDLHDVLGHTLSVIVLKAELAGRLLDAHTQSPDPQTLPRPRAEIGEVENTSRTALSEVREA